MGWKTLKETFGIEHQVSVDERGICIGSGYISDLAVIDPKTGRATENPLYKGFLSKHYPLLANAPLQDIISSLEATDTFNADIPVYTFDHQGRIIRDFCETPGWPNLTHSGQLMHDNRYFSTPEEALIKARDELTCAIENRQSAINDLEQDLQKKKNGLAVLQQHLGALDQNGTSVILEPTKRK